MVSALFGNNEAISQYVDILTGRAIEWGLLGPREADRIWSRHIFNSMALSGLVRADARVVDVGSGAGLPGLPLAIARPDLDVTLLEPLARRFEFLRLTVAELELRNVVVARGRAEDWPKEGRRFDVITARAVAPLEKLVGWTRRLPVPGGEILALKGESAEREIAEAAAALRRWRLRADVLEVRAHALCEPTCVVRVSGSVG